MRFVFCLLGLSLLAACATDMSPSATTTAADPAETRPAEVDTDENQVAAVSQDTQTAAPTADALSCLTQAVYFEARGRPEKDLRAVAHVVMNRVGHRRFPKSVCGVVRQGGSKARCQFSWYCDGRSDVMRDGRERGRAERVAKAVLAGTSKDPTGGAQFFHNQTVRPSWSRRLKRTIRIGPHTFYRYP